MRTHTKFFNFSKLARADGASTVVRVAMVCNDLAIANSALGHFKNLSANALSHVRQGNQQNQQRALELLLALESDYIPPGTKPKQARRPIAWYLVFVYVFGFLSFTPTLCMGIWAGKRPLRWWNLWMRFNTVIVPGLVLARWVYPQLFSTLEAALGH